MNVITDINVTTNAYMCELLFLYLRSKSCQLTIYYNTQKKIALVTHKS